MVRDRLTRRVHRAADVTGRTGITVLADLPDDPGELDAVAPARIFAPHHPLGRAFHRLRNEVVASLAADERTLLVTAASPGSASTVVAANLAAALARSDNDVIVVGANVPEIGSATLTLARLFDVADVPGLTDVLAGRTPLDNAVQRAARDPAAAGRHARAVRPAPAGCCRQRASAAAIHALRRRARYLVVEAPSAASGADAQSLAGMADAAILVVAAGETRHAQVTDAALQLKRVGTRLLGAVIVPPLSSVDIDQHLVLVPPPGPDAAYRSGPPSEVWLNDPRAAMNAPTSAIRQVDAGRPSTPAQYP